MTTKKDFKINEAVLVTYHVLDSVYQHFCLGYPKEIDDEIVNLITHLMDYIDPQDKSMDVDMSDYEIIKSVIYKDKKAK